MTNHYRSETIQVQRFSIGKSPEVMTLERFISTAPVVDPIRDDLSYETGFRVLASQRTPAEMERFVLTGHMRSVGTPPHLRALL